MSQATHMSFYEMDDRLAKVSEALKPLGLWLNENHQITPLSRFFILPKLRQRLYLAQYRSQLAHFEGEIRYVRAATLGPWSYYITDIDRIDSMLAKTVLERPDQVFDMGTFCSAGEISCLIDPITFEFCSPSDSVEPMGATIQIVGRVTDDIKAAYMLRYVFVKLHVYHRRSIRFPNEREHTRLASHCYWDGDSIPLKRFFASLAKLDLPTIFKKQESLAAERREQLLK